MRDSQIKTEPRYKIHSSQKLATLLLRIDTAICRAGGMHSENAQVHTVVYCSGGERSVKCIRPALEMEASKEVWFVSWWQSSFSNLSVTSPTSQFIFQPFFRFSYVTAHSPTLPFLRLLHSSISNPTFASAVLILQTFRHFTYATTHS